MDIFEITPTEAKVLHEILVGHEARTLDPECSDFRELNLMLDKLRLMLLGMADN